MCTANSETGEGREDYYSQQASLSQRNAGDYAQSGTHSSTPTNSETGNQWRTNGNSLLH